MTSSVDLISGAEFNEKIKQEFDFVDDIPFGIDFDYFQSSTESAPYQIGVPNIDFPYLDEYHLFDVYQTGTLIGFADYSSPDSLIKILILSNYEINVTDASTMFYDMPMLRRVNFNNFNTENCYTFSRMFMNCTSLEYVDMSNLALTNGGDYSEMFSGCSSCKWIDMSNLEAPSIGSSSQRYTNMFRYANVLRKFRSHRTLSLPDDASFPFTPASTFDSASTHTRTLYSTDVVDESFQDTIISLKDLEAATQQIAQAVAASIRYNQKSTITPA